MAKKPKKAKEAKKSPSKLPKTIAGIKVPKKLREPGGKMLEALSHPLIADAAAAALLMAAAALRDSKPVKPAASTAKVNRDGGAEAIVATIAAVAGEGAKRIARKASERKTNPAD